MDKPAFFFSSRRRHTRLQGDWSSDVCSSDLRQRPQSGTGGYFRVFRQRRAEYGSGGAIVDSISMDPRGHPGAREYGDRKSTRLNSSHLVISYAVFCLKKKKSVHDMSPMLVVCHHL